MAVLLDDVVSRLPTEFLTSEEELLMAEADHLNDKALNRPEFDPALSFPTEFPYEFDSLCSSSPLSSPVESLVSSADTHTADEDDFLAGLTRRLSQELAFKPEKWILAGSPESTLSGIQSWSASSNGSPNGVVSPPTMSFGAKTTDTWDQINEAAGKVATLKMSNESTEYSSCRLLGPARSQTPHTALIKQTSGFHSTQILGPDFSQMNQVEQTSKPHWPSVWERQQVRVIRPQVQLQNQHHHIHQQQQLQSRSERSVGHETNGRCGLPLGLPHSAWPPHKVQPNQHHHHYHQNQQLPQRNAGMMTRGVFVNRSSGGVKKECAGTGVFFPRKYGNRPDHLSKKSAKGVQAMNFCFDDINMHAHTQPRFINGLASDYDVVVGRRNAGVLAQQKRSLRHEGVLSYEIRLPQEWTY